MNSSIGKDAFVLTLSRVIEITLSFVIVMVLSRTLSLVEYGTYSQIMLIMSFTSALFVLGFPASINFFIARSSDSQDKQNFLSVYYTFSSVVSIVAGIVIVLLLPFIKDYYKNDSILNFKYFFLLYPWVVIIKSSIANVLIVYSRLKKLVKFNLTHSIFILFLVVSSKILNLGFDNFLMYLLLIELLFTIWIYIIVYQVTGKLNVKFDLELLKRIFGYALPIGLATIVGTIGIQLDKMIIAKFYSTEVLAVYTNASKEMPVTFIASSITAVLIPDIIKKLKQGNKTGALSTWKEASIISYIFICFFSIFLFVFASEVITILYSDKYIDGISIFRIYSIALLLRFTYFGMILNATGKTKFILYSSIFSLILNLILSIFLYKHIGYLGPAYATLISMLIVANFQLLASCKIIGVKYRDILPWKQMLLITIINICLGILFSVIKGMFDLQSINSKLIGITSLGFIWMLLYTLIMRKKIKPAWNLIQKK